MALAANPAGGIAILLRWLELGHLGRVPARKRQHDRPLDDYILFHNPHLRKCPGRWQVRNAGVQATNLAGPWSVMGLLTYGECWHNNHHAFPESAMIGLEKEQYDPAWWFIAALEYLGLAHEVGRPRSEDQRDDLSPI